MEELFEQSDSGCELTRGGHPALLGLMIPHDSDPLFIGVVCGLTDGKLPTDGPLTDRGLSPQVGLPVGELPAQRGSLGRACH